MKKNLVQKEEKKGKGGKDRRRYRREKHGRVLEERGKREEQNPSEIGKDKKNEIPTPCRLDGNWA